MRSVILHAVTKIRAVRSRREKPSWQPRKSSTEGIFQSVLVNYLVSQARTVEGSVNRALARIARAQRTAGQRSISHRAAHQRNGNRDRRTRHSPAAPGKPARCGRPPDRRHAENQQRSGTHGRPGRESGRARHLACRHGRCADSGRTRADDRRRPRHGLKMPGRADLSERGSRDASARKRRRWWTNIATGFSRRCLPASRKIPSQAAPNLQFVLASRHLERIADHATNIAEDILFWVRGLEVRHGGRDSWKRAPKTRRLRARSHRTFHRRIIVDSSATSRLTASRWFGRLAVDRISISSGVSRPAPEEPRKSRPK